MSARVRKLLPGRRFVRALIAALIVIVLLCLVVPLAMAPYVRGKLQAMVASRVNADLRMGALTYLPPFGVRVNDAKLVTRDGNNVELLNVKRFELRLARLPFGEGPLVIERIRIDDPQVQLIVTEQGILGVQSLFHNPGAPAPPPQLPPGTKLSDMFQLRQLELSGGRVVVEDRTRPGSVPMVWSQLSARTQTTPTSPSAYTFQLDGKHEGVASLSASGSFDMDELHLVLANATLTARSDPSKPSSALPAQIDTLLRRHHLAGTVTLTGSADVPLKNRPAGKWTLARLHGSMHAGPNGGRLDFDVRGTGPLQPPPGQTFSQAADVRGTIVPHNFRVQPPKFPLPLENVGGDGNARVTLNPGVIVLENISATYGGDAIQLRSARIPLPPDLRELEKHFAVEEIAGRIDFRRHPNPPYPRKFGKVVENLRPQGPFEIGGGSFVHVSRVAGGKRKTDWFFGVSTDSGSLTLSDYNVTVSDITGDATVSPLLIDVTRLDGSLLGGTGSATGKIVPRRPYPVEDGKVSLRDIDLAAVSRTFQPDNPNEKRLGRGFLNFAFTGHLARKDEVSPTDVLRGHGEFEVIKGEFWTLPVLGQIASQTKRKDDAGTDKPAPNGFTLGEAAGVFRVEKGKVLLDNAAINSPALGLVGSGTIGFDRSLDLRMYAAPLGDWRDNLKQARIPIVSNVAGEVIGGVQRLLNLATGTLLYQFRVAGQLGDPKVETIPAPVITDPAALLFGKMLDERTRLIDAVRGNPSKKPER